MLIAGCVMKSRQPLASHSNGSPAVSDRVHRLGIGRRDATGGIIDTAFLPAQE
jgi:hypothetical protein